MNSAFLHSATRARLRACLLLGAAAGCIALTSGASAQTVFRCGSSYSQTPCDGARPVDVSDPRDAQQRTDTLRATRTDARLAHDLQATREQAERDELMARRSVRGDLAEPVRRGKPRTTPRPAGDLVAIDHQATGKSSNKGRKEKAKPFGPGVTPAPAIAAPGAISAPAR